MLTTIFVYCTVLSEIFLVATWASTRTSSSKVHVCDDHLTLGVLQLSFPPSFLPSLYATSSGVDPLRLGLDSRMLACSRMKMRWSNMAFWFCLDVRQK